MKKTVVIPNDKLNKNIVMKAGDCDSYAEKITKLPNDKKSRKTLWVAGTLAACLLVAVGLSVFLRAPKEPWYNTLPVADELFETAESVGGDSNDNGLVISYESLDEYIEHTDLVVVGYPVNTFTSDPPAYYDFDNNHVQATDNWRTLDTVREIKILDVIKGDIDTDSIKIRVSEVAIWNDDGSFTIKEMGPTGFIQKKNVKYIFLLNVGNGDYNGEETYFVGNGCCINVDGLHKSSLKYVDGEIMLELMKRYAEYFEKYDRSDEVEYELDDEKHMAISGTRYFNNEQDAFEYSDLVIVGSPKNELKDDIRISTDGKELTDDEVKYLSRGQVLTARDTNVLKVIKGDADLESVYIATERHKYYDIHTKGVESWSTIYSPYEDPLCKKDSVYIYYLKKDDSLGKNVYRLAGRQCVINVDGTHHIGGLYRYTAKRVYEIFMRNIDIFKQYLPKSETVE